MIEVLYYSIAGKKANEAIGTVLQDLLAQEYIPSKDKKIVQHTIDVASKGAYPGADYYSTHYAPSSHKINALAEILHYADQVKDFYRRQKIQRDAITAINVCTSSAELLSSLNSLEDGQQTTDDLDKFEMNTYSTFLTKPQNAGIKLGIPEIDDITNGFQPGTVGSICAYVGEGKTTAWLSCIYKAAMNGIYTVVFSLELPPELLWLMLQARYLYEEKGMDITTQDLIMRKLTDEKAKKTDECEADFRESFKTILIVDESVFSKAILTDYKQLSMLYNKLQQKLGGLDFTVWDHVHQLELMFPTFGNIAIRTITSATKTWENNKGSKTFGGLAVQVNREGKKRAARREGLYDLQAISDLNEVERSSTYCVFLFTSDESKIVQETKVCMLKHRLGSVLTEPAITSFNPAVITVGSVIETITSGSFDVLGGDFGDSSFDDPFS